MNSKGGVCAYSDGNDWNCNGLFCLAETSPLRDYGIYSKCRVPARQTAGEACALLLAAAGRKVVAKCRGAASADRIANQERCELTVEESLSRGEYQHRAR